MSFITSGVKICDRPSRYLVLSAGVAVSDARPVAVRAAFAPLPARATGSRTRTVTALRLLVTATLVGRLGGLLAINQILPMNPLEHELLLARFQIVVIPQLLAGDDLAEVVDALGWKNVVHAQLAGEPLAVEFGHLRPDGVHAQAARLAADVDRAV